MYLILSGTHPFKANNNFDLASNILNSDVKFTGIEWYSVSKPAKMLIRSMLQRNPQMRPSLEDILNSKWIKKYCKSNTEEKFLSYEAVKNLMLFNSERKMEQAL